MVSSVVATGPSGNPAAVVRLKSLVLGELPGGAPGVVHPSVPVSKEVVPSPVETSMSSTKTPRPWVAQSLA
jgi:hypothetical protein